MLRTLKRLLHPLIHTPLHPQWLLDERTHVVRLLKQYHVPGAVLDVGCGDAWAKRLIGNGEIYIGLDYPETAIKEYGTRPDIFGDAHQLPFDSNLFQNVWLLDVLEHLADPQRVLAEARAVFAESSRPSHRLLDPRQAKWAARQEDQSRRLGDPGRGIPSCQVASRVRLDFVRTLVSVTDVSKV